MVPGQRMKEQRARDKDSETPLVYNGRPTEIDSDGLVQLLDAKCFVTPARKSRSVLFGLPCLEAARTGSAVDMPLKFTQTIRMACVVRQSYLPQHSLPTY